MPQVIFCTLLCIFTSNTHVSVKNSSALVELKYGLKTTLGCVWSIFRPIERFQDSKSAVPLVRSLLFATVNTVNGVFIRVLYMLVSGLFLLFIKMIKHLPEYH